MSSTPSGRGKPGGSLNGIHPVDLLAHRPASWAQQPLATVDDVIGGCVGQAEQTLQRHATPSSGPASPPRARRHDRPSVRVRPAIYAVFATQGIMTGNYDIAIACGVESMSSSNRLLDHGRRHLHGENGWPRATRRPRAPLSFLPCLAPPRLSATGDSSSNSPSCIREAAETDPVAPPRPPREPGT
jgi:acetyl-CoA acetyltransferase